MASLLGAPVAEERPLSGGCIGDVRLWILKNGERYVAKVAPQGGLETEGFMLAYLREHSALPVPGLLLAEDRLLVMDYLPHDGQGGEQAQEELAGLLAELHGISARAFGLERDSLIGSLPQANPWTESWIAFFRDQRLLPLAERAAERGALQPDDRRILERLAERLEDYLEEPEAPALLHGDCWSGNVLFDRGRVAGLVDPAIYYGHPEIELAFGTLFGPFGERFFARYGELRPIRPGFFEVRRDLYNLYPLLVHAVLFGPNYGKAAGRIAGRLV